MFFSNPTKEMGWSWRHLFSNHARRSWLCRKHQLVLLSLIFFLIYPFSTIFFFFFNLCSYNIKLQCNPPPLCYDFTNVTNYLNDPKVQASLGVKSGITWETCNDQINGMFGVDRIERLTNLTNKTFHKKFNSIYFKHSQTNNSFKFDIPNLLASGIQVLVYSGKLDLM